MHALDYIDRRTYGKPSEHYYRRDENNYQRPLQDESSSLSGWKICLLFLILFVFLAVLGIAIGVPVGLKLSEKYCPALTVPENGQLIIGQLIRNKNGMAAVMKCNEGFYFTTNTPSGVNQFLSCGDDGTWSEEVKQCIAAKCPDVEIPEHASATSGSPYDNLYNEYVEITCDEGYAMTDGSKSQRLTCRRDGTWDKRLDRCRSSQCPVFIPPRHSILTSGELSGNQFESEVTLTAEVGYAFTLGATPELTQTLTCLDGGVWSEELKQPIGIPVDGVWSEWKDWNPDCNLCKSGMRKRVRYCDDPTPLHEGEPCAGEDVEDQNGVIVEHQEEACTVQPECVTVFATKQGEYDGPGDDSSIDLPFDEVVYDKTESMTNNPLEFTAPMEGLYMFGLTAGRRDFQTLQLDLTDPANPANPDPPDGVLQCKIANTIDGGRMYVQNRHFIRKLSAAETRRVSIPESYGGAGGEAADAYTSFSVFSITHLFEPAIAFEAGISISEEKAGSIFSTSEVVVDDSGVFNAETGIFTAPVDGLYFLSVKGWLPYDYTPGSDSCSISDPGISFSVDSTCNGRCGGFLPITFEYLQIDCEGGVDPIGRSVIYELTAGDEITFVNTGPDPLEVHGTEDLQTAMNGFLYAPKTVDPVAFCAFYLGEPFTVIENWDYALTSHSIDIPAKFDTVLINVGDGFIDNFFDCTIPGLYFVYFSNGHKKTQTSHLVLRKNTDPIAGLYAAKERERRDHGILGRSAVVELKEGDRLQVLIKGGTYFGNEKAGENRASFMGILLQPPIEAP